MKYNRKFARNQWRKSFENTLIFRFTHGAGQSNSFRKFTGRCKS
jgi:hypothetical protein